MLSLGGADAVTSALKTAVMATGKTGVIAFEGSYHGLTYGPLAVSGYSDRFRTPFAAQLQPDVRFAPWPRADEDASQALSSLPEDWSAVGAVIVEPIQGRAGVRLPPPGFLKGLEQICRERGALLIVDEIFTGLGRCGAWWRSIDDGATPDLICAGKALGGGLPISACVGREEVMQAWGTPEREAIHTGTFYGDPLGAAAALATLSVIERERSVDVAAKRGAELASEIRTAELPGIAEVRQAGMMFGLQLEGDLRALTVTRSLLERGYLVLPAGTRADVIQLAPAVTVTAAQLEGFIAALRGALETG